MTRAEWSTIIERGIFLVSRIPAPSLRRIPVPGVLTRSFRYSHPLANVVGGATLSDHDAAPAIAATCDFFRHHGEAFSWRVGPGSTPPGLERRLEAAGLRRAYQMRGLVMEDLAVPGSTVAGITTRAAGPEDLADVTRLIAAGYPAPLPFAATLAEVYLHPGAVGLVRVYLAFAAGSTAPVGLGVCYDVPDRPIVLLTGAAVVPTARKRGVYRALLARRLADAADRRIESAAMQAVANTSAAICKRLGFRDLFGIEVLEWWPPARPGPTG